MSIILNTVGKFKMKSIYCAGPLFNPKEREDMDLIASTLEKSGYKVFLPHRDGIEFAKLNSLFVEMGHSLDEANSISSKAIFFIDTFQVLENDGLVLNLNGRVPDEGAMVEAGIGWALGKPIVIYKNDSRSLLSGQDNPLVAGLSKFKIISNVEDLPDEFNRAFSNGFRRVNPELSDISKFIFEKGKSVYEAFKDIQNTNRLSKILSELLTD